MKRCTAYCTAKSYALNKLSDTFQQERDIIAYGTDAISMSYKNGRAFCFDSGVVVFWNMESTSNEEAFLKLLKPHEHDSLTKPFLEEFHFDHGESPHMENDIITLAQQGDDKSMLSASFAIAQSMKLKTYEERIEQAVSDTDHISLSLAERGRIPLSRKVIGMKIGQLFRLRSFINVQSAFLETPSFFWENTAYEPGYHVVATELDLAERTHMLNEKLDMIHDFYQILGDELGHRHSQILEYVIVILILIEVVMGISSFFIPGTLH